MKAVKYLLFGLMAAALLAGCGKQPTQDIDAAKAAVDAVAADAEKFASEEAKAIKGSLQAAMDEVKTQDGTTFKNYDKAKNMLTKVKSDADALKTAIPQKKEAAKNNAISAQDAAKNFGLFREVFGAGQVHLTQLKQADAAVFMAAIFP